MHQSVSTYLPRRVTTVTVDPALAAEHAAPVVAFQAAMAASANPDPALFVALVEAVADDADDDPPLPWLVLLTLDVDNLDTALATGDVIARLVDLAVPAVDVGLTAVTVDGGDGRRHRVYCDRRLTAGRCRLRAGHRPGCLARGFAPATTSDPAVLLAQTALQTFAAPDLDRDQARRILSTWVHYAALSGAQVDLIVAAYPPAQPDRHDTHWGQQ